MKQILTYFLAVLLFSGCVFSNSNKSQSEQDNLRFIDTKTFDQKLLKSMSAELDTVTVSMIGDVSVNSMPERLGKWLSTVEEQGGQVGLKAKKFPQSEKTERTTGAIPIGLILGILPTAYGFLKEEYVAKRVGKYNAILIYDPRNGLLEKVVFTKKEKVPE